MGDRGKRLRGKIQVREIFKGESWLAGWLVFSLYIHRLQKSMVTAFKIVLFLPLPFLHHR
jgi:hypothetical protein